MKALLILFIAATLCACIPAKGKYRMPYANGTLVNVVTDHETHTTPEAAMYDLVSVPSPQVIVAAAPGWVRYIEDSHSNVGTLPNNYVWIEHPYPFCQNPNDRARASWPGKPSDYAQTCTPCEERYCNEWTVYAHMVTGSVSGDGFFSAGLSEGDWVEAGQAIGIEGEVGYTQGVHLHWFVAVIDPLIVPDANGYYSAWLNTGIEEPERVPVVCHANGETILSAGLNYTAVPCL